MSTIGPPLANFRPGRSGDDLDGLLRTFFQAELPRPWPKAPLPEPLPVTNGHGTIPFPSPARPAAQPWRLTSRLALAASIGGLLLGTLLLSGQFKPDPNLGDGAANLGDGAANRKTPVMTEVLEQKPGQSTEYKFEFYDPF